jgi:hypothetical protein
MHPFCCVSAISDQASPVKPPSPFTDFTMPPPPPSVAVRSDSTAPIHSHSHSNGSQREQPAVVVDLKINDLVGNGISGILYKWVNYGKGDLDGLFYKMEFSLTTRFMDLIKLSLIMKLKKAPKLSAMNLFEGSIAIVILIPINIVENLSVKSISRFVNQLIQFINYV